MKKPGQPFLVAIVGGSGSGKTWLADKLKAALGSKAGRLSLDHFYRDRSRLSPARRAGINFDNPAAIDWRSFERVITRLVQGRSTPVPVYDFKTHCRVKRSKLLRPTPIMIVEGLWLLRAPRVRRFFDFRIFLDSSTRTRLGRRLARDIVVRGRSRKSVQEQFWKTVQPMHQKFVMPQMRRADIVFKKDPAREEVSKLATLLRQTAQDSSTFRNKPDVASV